MSKSLDKIYIRDLLLRCIIGIFPEERTKKTGCGDQCGDARGSHQSGPNRQYR